MFSGIRFSRDVIVPVLLLLLLVMMMMMMKVVVVVVVVMVDVADNVVVVDFFNRLGSISKHRFTTLQEIGFMPKSGQQLFRSKQFVILMSRAHTLNDHVNNNNNTFII